MAYGHLWPTHQSFVKAQASNTRHHSQYGEPRGAPLDSVI